MVKESSLRTEIIPAKLLSHDFSFVEGFFTGINLHKKKWLIKCSSNLHKSNIGKHFDIISGSLDTLSVNHKNIHFLVILMHVLMMRLYRIFTEGFTEGFCESYPLHSPIKQSPHFRNPKNYRILIALKIHFHELPPKIPHKHFMTKAYSKAVMHGTLFKNKFLKNPTDQRK